MEKVKDKNTKTKEERDRLQELSWLIPTNQRTKSQKKKRFPIWETPENKNNGHFISMMT